MSEPIPIFDGEALFENAKVSVNQIGTGLSITVIFTDEEDTPIIAGTRLVPDAGADLLIGPVKIATELMTELRAQLKATVK